MATTVLVVEDELKIREDRVRGLGLGADGDDEVRLEATVRGNRVELTPTEWGVAHRSRRGRQARRAPAPHARGRPAAPRDHRDGHGRRRPVGTGP